MYPVIIHIPHSSTLIPVELRKKFIINNEELENELLVMTDCCTDELFSYPGIEY